MIIPISLFVDTGFHVALASAKDRYHKEAFEYFKELNNQVELITTDHIISETYTHILYSKNGGYLVALKFLSNAMSAHDSNHMTIINTTSRDLRAAQVILEQYSDQTFSMCDAISFVVMERLSINSALAFDKHFYTMGKTVLPGPVE